MAHIEVFENEKAQNYEQFVDTWILGYRDFIENLPNVLSHTLNKKLLVAGCGTGNEMACFAKHDKNWVITGVDPSPQMLAQAKTQLADVDNVRLIQGVVNDLDSDEKYGAATLLLVLHFMQDNGEKLALLTQIAERLEANAPFVLLDITGNGQYLDDNLSVFYTLLASKQLPELELKSRIQRIKNELHAVSEQRIAELLVSAGFKPPVRFYQNTIYMGWLTAKR